MKPFLHLIVRSERQEADREHDAILRFGELAPQQLHRLDLAENPLPPINLSDYSGIILGGSAFNMSDPTAQKSALQNRVEADIAQLLDEVVALDYPFLGMCYGIGTIGAHQGAIVDKQYGEAAGPVTIALTPAGLADPITNGMSPEFTGLVGHKEAISKLPDHAKLLATSPQAPVQMFRIKNNIYATQFHPELDVPGIVARMKVYQDFGYFDKDKLAEAIAHASSQPITETQLIIRNFIRHHAKADSATHTDSTGSTDSATHTESTDGTGRTESTDSTEETELSDRRIRTLDPLPAPDDFRKEFALGSQRARLVHQTRKDVAKILKGEDDRLLVIVGPCSVHDPVGALEYAHRLATAAHQHRDQLVLVMRVYFEKPRTTVGWKGLINDPFLDGTHNVIEGLKLARKVLLSVLDAGVPIATEFLEPTSPQYIADAVSWGAIGARNTESQVHRQLASGLSMPIGFKNSTDGDVRPALDSCLAASSEHTFFGADGQGRAAAVATKGNPDCHVVLRGGRTGPNYSQGDVSATVAVANAMSSQLGAAAKHGVVIDASHGNSGKDHVRQAEVVRELAARLAAGEQGISGLMMESNLVAGAQAPGPLHTLTYGQSITDSCLDWETTAELLDELALAIAANKQQRMC